MKSQERKRILENIKDKTGNQIKVVTTNSLTTYTNIVKEIFDYSNKERKYTIKHNVINVS